MSSSSTNSSLQQAAGLSTHTRFAEGPERDVGDSIVLPSEVLAYMMEYLPYETILSCAATCKSFLHDTMPLLKKLHINTSYQMDLRVAARYRDIREIHINSLMIENAQGHAGYTYNIIEVDFESTVRVVPFLSRFTHLEKVTFGGRTPNGKIVDYFAPINGYYEDDEDDEEDGANFRRMLTSIDNISAGFRVGSLPKDLKIYGLCCPKSRYRGPHSGGGECEVCLRASRSFPLESVVSFESRGSSRGKVKAKRPYVFDSCMSREQIEFVVETRPGGSAMLKSKGRIMQLLGEGSRYEVVSDDGKAFVVVKFKQEELDELARVIQYAQIDLKRLSADEVGGAIMRSFAAPLSTCSSGYLSEASYDSLKQLELPLPEKDVFYSSSMEDMLDHLPQLARVVKSSSADYGDIFIDCLKLIKQFLEIENNPPIERVLDPGLGLVQSLKRVTYPLTARVEASTSLNIIMAKGNVEQRQVLIDAKVLSAFTGLLYCTTEDSAAVTLAVEGLVHIVGCESNDAIEELTRQTTILKKLVCFLDSKKDSAVVEGALKVLSAIAKAHCKQVVEAGILPHLLRILNESTNVGILSNASALLSTIIEARDRGELPLQTNTIPRIIDLMNKYPDSEVLQTNLAGVAFALSSNSNALSDALVAAGFVPILCNLLHSLDDDIVKKAVVTVGRIADNTLSHRELMLKEGVVSSLLGLLEYSCDASTLEVLGICCRGKSSATDASEGLNVLLKLLVNKDGDVHIIGSVCVAMFHLLDGLDIDELKQVGANTTISTEVTEPLLKLLPRFNGDEQKSAMKCIHLMTKMGDKFIESIATKNGLSAMNELLVSKSHSTHVTVEVACSTISTIILADNPRQIQLAIDIGMIARIITMLSDIKFRVKKSALHVIHQLVVMSDSSDHIEYLASRDIVKPLCDLLYSDCKVANMAVEALQSIVNFGKEKRSVTPKQTEVDDGSKSVGSKLQELMDENQNLELEQERLGLLKKKKAWVVYDAQKEHLNSLNDAFVLLKEQVDSVQTQLKLFEETTATKASLKGACELLKNNHASLRAQQAVQIKQVKVNLDEVETKTKRLLTSAEKIAPMKEWHERLQQTDLPVDLSGLDAALKESTTVVKSIESTRIGWQRKEDIDALSTSINDLFKDKDDDEGERDESRKRKMSEDDDADDAAEDNTAGEEASNHDNDGNGKAKKKKRQSAISSFFVGKSKSNAN